MTAGPQIAVVALNVPLRRTFDYLVPLEMQGAMVPGLRVVVPFGTRLRAGVVVALGQQSTLPLERLRPIARLVESLPVFSGEMLEFTRWLASYYFCGWGEVLESALPSGLGIKFVAHYEWKAQRPAPESLRALNGTCQKLILSGNSWDDQQWRRAKPGAVEQVWLRKALQAKSLLVEHRFSGTRGATRTEKWLKSLPAARTGELLSGSRSPATASLPAARTGELPAFALRKNSRAARILSLLGEVEALPMGQLRTKVSNPAAVVKKLEQSGLVATFDRPLPEGSIAQSAVAPEEFLQLNEAQQAVFQALRQALLRGAYRGFLLQGVTGSGKTEVYLHAVRETVALNRSCLILVPEIALTAEMVNRFRSRFGRLVAVLHSGMGERERFEEWRRVKEGQARIVIGARSAVFAPLENLGLVVVDEEHDGSYKQDEAPRYHGRDSALLRGFRNKAVVLLGSATPSMESLHNAELGKLEKWRLAHRVTQHPLPRVDLLDLRTVPRQQSSVYLTKPLVSAVRETLSRGEQVILFLNRRGFARMAHCTACEAVVTCQHCSITLTYHQGEARLRCHRCDFRQALPALCPQCQAPAVEVAGIGTERIAEDAARLFPKANVLRMDSDSLRRRGELERRMADIRKGKFNVIIGTQILSKGHDFPNITLVAAVLADVSLNFPDFRAPERTFQVLTQMAGRAGRGTTKGRVLIQSYNPEHYGLQHVLEHDADAFSVQEQALRREMGYPPYQSMALVWCSAPDAARAEAMARRTAVALQESLRPEVRMLGPAEAPIIRISGRFRWMVQLRAATMEPIHRTLRAALDASGFTLKARERLSVDIDPYNLL